MAAARCDHCGGIWIMQGDPVHDERTPAACPYCGQQDEFTTAPGEWIFENAQDMFKNGWAQPTAKA